MKFPFFGPFLHTQLVQSRGTTSLTSPVHTFHQYSLLPTFYSPFTFLQKLILCNITILFSTMALTYLSPVVTDPTMLTADSIDIFSTPISCDDWWLIFYVPLKQAVSTNPLYPDSPFSLVLACKTFFHDNSNAFEWFKGIIKKEKVLFQKLSK